jgi:hypothetical protein
MKTIPLTQGLVAVVEDQDFAALSKFKWYAAKKRNGQAYAVRGDYSLGRSRRTTIHMSRCIIECAHGYVDHINGNSLDNRRGNLRVCTNQQNSFNKTRTTKRGGVTTKFKGICWHKRLKKWQANICFNSRKIHIGYFDTEAEAACAYDQKCKHLFGQFAAPNFNNAEVMG